MDNGVKISGFAAATQDYAQNEINLNKELIVNPSSTFFGRVEGESMIDEGITDGDILIIDKSLTIKENDLIVCFIDGEFTLRKVMFEGKSIWLVAANKKIKKILLKDGDDIILWGVVTYTIKSLRGKFNTANKQQIKR